MNPEQLQELEEKAKLWDELSPLLKTIHGSKFERPSPRYLTGNGEQNKGFSGVYGNGTTTIENTSNASSHVGVLEQEQYEWVSIGEERIKLIIPPQIKEEFNEGLCSCGDKKFGHFSRCQSCLDIYSGHSGNGNF